MLIIGGSFSGLAAGRDLGSHYLVTIIDAKELVDFLWISYGFPMDSWGMWLQISGKNGEAPKLWMLQFKCKY